MMGSVLITGGSGVTGKYLTSLLLSEGYEVSHLSRGHDQFGRVRVYRWDPIKGILDPSVFQGVDYVIHLAGADIGQKRWTIERKREIFESRILSARLIFRVVSENNISLKGFISASGTSYYGTKTSERIFTESDQADNDFPAYVCTKWEEAADLFATRGIRTVKIRAAPYLEKNGTFLKKLTIPAQFGFLGMAGTGRQYMPWIHMEDLCRIYLKAISDESMTGVYNAVAPDHVTHRQFMRTLSKVIRRPLVPIPLPGIFLRVYFGKLAIIALEGSRISSEKIKNAGYRFRFEKLHEALEEVYKSALE